MSLFFVLLMQISFAYHHVVDELRNYVQTNETFALQLNITFEEAAYSSNSSSPVTYDDMYNFFDAWLDIALPPNNETWIHTLYKFGCATSTGSQLFSSTKSQQWMLKYMVEMRKFADSVNSTYIIPKWIDYYNMNMSQYVVPVNGYQSFNTFFTRKLNKTLNLRPIDSPNNDSIITSPCDGTIMNLWLNNLTLNDTYINIKGITYNLSQILNYNQHYISKFIGGSLINIFLNESNYHRYHSSVSGIINEIDQINGYLVWVPQQAVSSDYLSNVFWPNANKRTVVYIYNENIGTIANVYVGVGWASSIALNVLTGSYIQKGHETGCFKYGGSTIVLLFEPGVIEQFIVEQNEAILMGQRIANAVKIEL